MIDAAHRRARKYPPIRATYNACNMIANGVQIADYERLFGLGINAARSAEHPNLSGSAPLLALGQADCNQRRHGAFNARDTRCCLCMGLASRRSA
jgi:hypothetical protein